MGSWRDVFTLPSAPKAVLRIATWRKPYGTKMYGKMRTEGTISALLDPHPLLVDAYGFCGLSMFNEKMELGDIDDEAIPVHTRSKCNVPYLTGPELITNMTNFSPTEKLEYSLIMAESLSLLHNHKDGMIIHDDVHLAQFLKTKDGGLKLSDFNRATIPQYSEKRREYCKYKNGIGHHDWRSPEEYMNRPLNEKIDVWSHANNMYVMLTGLQPLPYHCSEKGVREGLVKGETNYVDPRWANHSYAEGALARIIEPCFAWNPDERPSMGELVVQLREAVAENRRLGNMRR